VTTRGALVTANAGGTDFALTYDSGTQTWVSTAGASIPAGVGPRDVTLKWEVRSGTAGGLTCSNGGSNPCKGSFGVLQRVMSAQVARSGPIQLAGLDTTTATNANSFPQGSTQSLIVRIGVGGSLGNAASVSDPIVTLRVTGGGSQNQTVDCDPNQSNIRDEIANGCTALYKKNLGTTCPASVSTLWASAQPWDCIAIQTGAATGQVRQGLQDRLQGGSTSCVNANKWSQFPNLAPSDPRLVPLLLTPFNTFQGSGSSTVPVTGLGTFYITGYDGSPCSGDDAAGGGNIVGHFVKYVNGFADDTTTGTDPCVFGAFDPCYAQMTE
uniref:hypothetical protein n=1 Tax=Paraconexibacter sp. TaxID=2949640 RepID=UPI00356466FA